MKLYLDQKVERGGTDKVSLHFIDYVDGQHGPVPGPERLSIALPKSEADTYRAGGVYELGLTPVPDTSTETTSLHAESASA